MIDAVLLFGAINIVFEFVLLSMIPPKHRLRTTRKRRWMQRGACTFFARRTSPFIGERWSARCPAFAFVASATVRFARKLFGHVANGRYYHVGWIKVPHEYRRP